MGKREVSYEDWMDRKLWKTNLYFGLRISVDTKKNVIIVN